jgi:hypothetical protein
MQQVHRHGGILSVKSFMRSGRYESRPLTASENMPGYTEKPPWLR